MIDRNNFLNQLPYVINDLDPGIIDETKGAIAASLIQPYDMFQLEPVGCFNKEIRSSRNSEGDQNPIQEKTNSVQDKIFSKK